MRFHPGETEVRLVALRRGPVAFQVAHSESVIGAVDEGLSGDRSVIDESFMPRQDSDYCKSFYFDPPLSRVGRGDDVPVRGE